MSLLWSVKDDPGWKYLGFTTSPPSWWFDSTEWLSKRESNKEIDSNTKLKRTENIINCKIYLNVSQFIHNIIKSYLTVTLRDGSLQPKEDNFICNVSTISTHFFPFITWLLKVLKIVAIKTISCSLYDIIVFI